MALKYKIFQFNPIEVNTYAIYDEHSSDCILVDVGCANEIQWQTLHNYIKDNNLKVKKLLLTHPHTDHFCGMGYAVKAFNLPISLHESAKKAFTFWNMYAQELGLEPLIEKNLSFEYLKYGQKINFANLEIEILDICGHCPGSIAYYIKQYNNKDLVLVGDGIFLNSIGRTDFPGADQNLLVSNIKSHIFTLPEDTIILCGHGPQTTVKYEKGNNPFLQ